MAIKIYNELTKQREEFIPMDGNKVKIYNCGLTVYDLFHIGNARNFITFDVVRRYLEYRGYDVKYIQNITDVDDKIINKANAEGVTSDEIAKRYTDIYFKYAEELNVKPPDVSPKATEHIPQMVKLVESLIEKGYAYEVEGDVFFSVRKFDGYGKLSGKNIDDLQEGARVDVDSRKKDPLDFALWKAAKPGEPYWDCPWGKGRPGWHIECSVMSMEYLGDSIDIHCGGEDLTFPHHENEIAQSEAATGKPFVKYWLHNAFINMRNEKMSKSLGNIVTIKDLLEEYDPQIIRFFMLTAHFRKAMDYSREVLEDARKGLERLRDSVDTIVKVYGTDVSLDCDIDSLKQDKIKGFKAKFEEAMDDDFNMPRALAVLFDISSYVFELKQSADADTAVLSEAVSLLIQLGEVLGLKLAPVLELSDNIDIENLMKLLIEVRAIARKEKQFAIADKVRDGLGAIDIVLEDHAEGTIWKRK